MPTKPTELNWKAPGSQREPAVDEHEKFRVILHPDWYVASEKRYADGSAVLTIKRRVKKEPKP